MKGSDKEGRHQAFTQELLSLKENNLLRTTTCVQPSGHSHVNIGGRPLSNFASNDYLDLSSHTDIVRAAVTSIRRHGFGSGASRLLSGTRKPHERLEKVIAQFKNTEAALLFNSGYAANTGILPALAGDEDIIFSDELNHASIIDGTRLSRAAVKIFRHGDLGHLEVLLRKSMKGKKHRRRIVVTDTVFSMDGDIAPLKEITELCHAHDAMLMIDDAHATGVLGHTGRGGLEHFAISPQGIIQMGTLSKAAGCYGAFVAGSRDMTDLCLNRARSFIFSTSLPSAVAAAGAAALRIIQSRSKRRRQKLWSNRDHLFQGLMDLGYDTLGSETPIVPVLAGDEKTAMQIGKRLSEAAIFAPAIRPPAVKEGRCRIRFTVTAGHRDEDIASVLECMRKI